MWRAEINGRPCVTTDDFRILVIEKDLTLAKVKSDPLLKDIKKSLGDHFDRLLDPALDEIVRGEFYEGTKVEDPLKEFALAVLKERSKKKLLRSAVARLQEIESSRARPLLPSVSPAKLDTVRRRPSLRRQPKHLIPVPAPRILDEGNAVLVIPVEEKSSPPVLKRRSPPDPIVLKTRALLDQLSMCTSTPHSDTTFDIHLSFRKHPTLVLRETHVVVSRSLNGNDEIDYLFTAKNETDPCFKVECVPRKGLVTIFGIVPGSKELTNLYSHRSNVEEGVYTHPDFITFSIISNGGPVDKMKKKSCDPVDVMDVQIPGEMLRMLAI